MDKPSPEIPLKLEIRERNEMMEQAKKERLTLSVDIASRIVGVVIERIPKSVQNMSSTTLDASPVGYIKMGMEAITGKKVTGEILSPKDRLMYSIIVTAHYASYPIFGYGFAKGRTDLMLIGGLTFTGATALWFKQIGPDAVKHARELTQDPKIIKFLEIYEPIFAEMAKSNIK